MNPSSLPLPATGIDPERVRALAERERDTYIQRNPKSKAQAQRAVLPMLA